MKKDDEVVESGGGTASSRRHYRYSFSICARFIGCAVAVVIFLKNADAAVII